MYKSYEEIEHEGSLFAIIIRSDYSSKEIVFFGKPDFSQQLGYLPHKKGNKIKAHFHKEIHRKIMLTQEVLFIKRGKIIVDFYTNDKKYVTSRILNTGDLLFLCNGGHGFEVLEDAEMFEVKQGPYSSKQKDKEVFRGIENDSSLRTFD